MCRKRTASEPQLGGHGEPLARHEVVATKRRSSQGGVLV